MLFRSYDSVEDFEREIATLKADRGPAPAGGTAPDSGRSGTPPAGGAGPRTAANALAATTG